MKKCCAFAWVGFLFFMFAPALQAADSASAKDCTFNPPQALLHPKAYSNYLFTRKSLNQSVETADVRKGIRIEISRSQCVDFIVNEITFIVSSNHLDSPNNWLEFARTEIARLERNGSAGDLRELQQFLVQARNIAQRNGIRSKCKDESLAEAGQCSWESMGGYIFEVKKSGSSVRISTTEYVSG